ncbi:MAG: ACP S-malonyltransferase [Alphaproteobacteria bacterium]|nr:ACP S-malonyltransferase [Alphaproteobacteria bacterium]
MKRALIFPGQGSQNVGMGKELADAFKAARHVFDQVDDALNQKLSHIMFEGSADELTLTANAQPALMAVSLAIMEVLEKDFGFKVGEAAAFVAGHSLGEYSALAADKVFSIHDASVLLRTRGNAMQQAVPVGKGGMAVLMGLSWDEAITVTKEAAAGDVCVCANDNAEGQVVISGDLSAIERAIKIATDKGAKRAMKLPVSAPFHSPLLQPAEDIMREALNSVEMRALVVPVVSNVTATATDNVGIVRERLIQQVTGTVRWRESVQFMENSGVTEFVEIGAGKVLTGLVKRTAPDAKAHAINTVAEIEEFAKNVQAGQ